MHAADWRVYFIVFMVLLLGPMRCSPPAAPLLALSDTVECRGVLREVYRLFVEDDGGQYGYDEWAEAADEGLIHAE